MKWPFCSMRSNPNNKKASEPCEYDPKRMAQTPTNPSPNSTDQTLPPSPQPLHQSDADEDDENVKQLRECSSLYLSLQDCLVKTNRNWKSCQTDVQALKECHERRKNVKGK